MRRQRPPTIVLGRSSARKDFAVRVLVCTDFTIRSGKTKIARSEAAGRFGEIDFIGARGRRSAFDDLALVQKPDGVRDLADLDIAFADLLEMRKGHRGGGRCRSLSDCDAAGVADTTAPIVSASRPEVAILKLVLPIVR